MKYEHFPIFSTPLYVGELNPPTQEEMEYLNSLEYKLNYGGGNLTSTDDFVLNTLPSLKSGIQWHLDKYISDVINPSTEFSFYITQSWVNKNKKGTRHKEHMHTNSIISGVFYFSDNPQPITFKKHFDFLELFQLKPKEYTQYNYNQFTFQPSKYSLVLFPSIIGHSVLENDTETDRMSLAFNTFFKGVFGSKSDMTLLELK